MSRCRLSVGWRLLGVLAVLALASCAFTPQPWGPLADGLGGTGQKVADGLGGTGQKVADGLGGTGQKVADGLGGTGIIGTITDFGSIWVNRAHVHLESARITANGEPADENALKLGQVVAILSSPIKGGYAARSIDIVHEVVGPISALDPQRGRLMVLGQVVDFDADTRIASETGASIPATQLAVGQWVEVSGLRDAGERIAATRIDRLEPQRQVQLIGRWRDGKVAGYPVKIPAWLSFDAGAARLLLKGRLEDGMIVASQVGKDAISIVVEQATELLLEGFLFDQAMDNDIVVGGIELVLPDDFEPPPDFSTDEPVYIDAEIGLGDELYVDDFLALPEGAEDYIDLYPDADDLLDFGYDDLLLDGGVEGLE